MNFDSDDFELFGLPRRFEQDRATVDARWHALQAEVHPDRFASEGSAAQRVALQWAVRVNEAHQRLKDPLKRAAYLCELNGAPVQAEVNTAMPAGFLVQQLEWREALADDVAQTERRAFAQLQRSLDVDRDFPAAAQQVRALMFIGRFASDVDHRLEALGQ